MNQNIYSCIEMHWQKDEKYKSNYATKHPLIIALMHSGKS